MNSLKPLRSEEGSLRDEIPQQGFGDSVPNVPPYSKARSSSGVSGTPLHAPI